MDSVEVIPKQSTTVPGVDYMTDYDSWLHIQVRAGEYTKGVFGVSRTMYLRQFDRDLKDPKIGTSQTKQQALVISARTSLYYVRYVAPAQSRAVRWCHP